MFLFLNSNYVLFKKVLNQLVRFEDYINLLCISPFSTSHSFSFSYQSQPITGHNDKLCISRYNAVGSASGL